MHAHAPVVRFPALAEQHEAAAAQDIATALGVATIGVSAAAPNALTVSVPLATPEQLYCRRQQDHWQLSIDPRALIDSRDEVDTTAITSLLQFGAIVPANTTHRPVQRLVPGRVSVIDATSADVLDQGPVSSWSRARTSPGSCTDRLSEAIDAVLEKSCPDRNPVVLFSGGVDSGVIAARIAKMGWSDALLLNYAMSEDDVQSQHAARVADELGLRIERIVRKPEFGDAFLRRIGGTYRQPFCDISCIPTMELADAAIECSSPDQPIIDGTGADGAFGLFRKAEQWSRIYRLPKVLRSLAADTYDRLGLGMRIGRPEYLMRLLARSMHRSPAVAAVAQASLHSEFFIAGEDPTRGSTALQIWLDETIGPDRSDIHLPALDLSLVCADRYAQKNKATFDAANRKVIYPFLDDSIVTMALCESGNWPDAISPKHTLKEILSSSIAPDLVYRPKAGFRPPIQDYLQRDAFAHALDSLIDEPGEMREVVNTRALRSAAELIAEGTALPATTLSIVWTAIVTHAWLTQINTSAPLA